MTATTRTTSGTRSGVVVGALALVATLALGACSGPQDEGGATSGPATDAAAATSGTAGPEAAGTSVDIAALPDPVAEVNGAEISRDDFLAAFEPQRDASLQQAQAGGAPLDEVALRDGVLDALVGSELLAQEGERLGLEATEQEVDAELQELASQNGAASAEELLTLLEQQGVDEIRAREEVGRIVVMDEILAEHGDVKAPTEQELKDYYAQMTGQTADDRTSDEAGATAGADQAPAFEDVRDQIEQQLTQQQEDEALNTLVTELRKDADVTSHL